MDKKRSESELFDLCKQIDVNKDGYISEADINTCIKNLTNSTFWRNGGVAMSKSLFNTNIKNFPVKSHLTNEKILEVLAQIKAAMGKNDMSYSAFFMLLD